MTETTKSVNESSIEISKRIKAARSLAGLSRRDFEDFHISPHTLQAWELGRNALTTKGGELFISALEKNGVICSLDWLFTGVGLGPTSKLLTDAINHSVTPGGHLDLDTEEIIQREIKFFCELNPEAAVMMVSDDTMLPFYAIGDFVAGSKLYNAEIAHAVGHDCIVEIPQGKFLRRLMKRADQYMLSCVNLKSTYAEPIMLTEIIISAAPVVWHRGRFTLS